MQIGIDTSCYTTSVSCVEGKSIVYDKRTVLSVRPGERGIRQSEGVFQHVRNLGAMLPELLAALPTGRIQCVAVASRPRTAPGSYMPVFLAGRTAAASVAAALHVPLYEFSHQEGHIRAALLGHEGMMEAPFLGMHISGGTTEIFRVEPGVRVGLLGGTTDLHAGQFIDRIGVAMGCPLSLIHI